MHLSKIGSTVFERLTQACFPNCKTKIMSIPRRKFFKIGAFSVLASLALGSRNFAESVAKSNGDFTSADSADRLLNLRAGDFRKQIGSRFEFSDGNYIRMATLTEVKGAKASDAKQINSNSEFDPLDFKCYSLTFQLSKPVPATQATYQVSHSILGKFKLFSVPGKVAAGEFLLVAVVNRI